MVGEAKTASGRTRITVDIDPELRRRVRIAAARRDISVGQWCLEALIDRLEDEEDAAEGMAALEDYEKNGGMSWDEYKRRRGAREG